MIKKKFKLKGEELKKFFAERKFKKISKENFLIFYKENELDWPRFAVICKKNIFKKAVLRNKIKRRIYEILRKEILPSLKKNYDFVIFPQKEKSYSDFEKSLKEIYKKINA